VTTRPVIVVDYAPGHEAATFDEAGTPILCHEFRPRLGWGWCLYYFADDTGGVDDYFIGGDLTDVDWALEQAEEWLSRPHPATP
jgi:hypothetical protein